MVARIVIFVLIVSALAGVLIYSQHRPVPDKVSGFIEAHEIHVGSRVGGRIARVLVEEGQPVKPGDPLIELEPFDLSARLAELTARHLEAEGQLQQQQETLKKLVAGFRVEEIAQAEQRRNELQAAYEKAKSGPRKQEIAEAQALYDQAVVQHTISSASYERVMKQVELKTVSLEDRDRATNDFKAASANLNVRREQLDLLKEGTRKEDLDAAAAQLAEATAAYELMKNGSRAEDIAVAKASVEAAKASVEAAKGAVETVQQQVQELKISASAKAIVEAVDIRPGDLLAANAPALALQDLSELWVRAYVPENRLDFKVGDKVRVTVDSFKGRNFSGEITFVARQAEFTPGNVQTIEERSKQVFRIKVTMKDGLDVLRPGMSADVWLK